MGDCLATIDMGRKDGGEGAIESQSNTILPGLRPTSVPSGILTIQLFDHNRNGLKSEAGGGVVLYPFLGERWIPS